MLKVEETNTSCAVEAVLFNSDTLSKIIPYLQTASGGKTTSDLFNLALTCTRFGIGEPSLIEESARIAVEDMITIDSSLSHWCHEGENSMADYHRIRSAQDIQKESLEYLKWMVLIDHDENGNRKLVRCNVTDDGQITFKDINLGGRQRGRRRRDAVLFNSDTLSKIISYIPSIDVLNLALTCKRFGISNNNENGSLIGESASIAIHDIATEEQLAALPHYEGESSLADYHYLQLMRKPLTFDQLNGFDYVNSLDKSNVIPSNMEAAHGWETACSNSILRAGKHYVTFELNNSLSSDRGTGELTNVSIIVGVMRPGQVNQDARSNPLCPRFYQHFSRRMRYGEDENEINVQCCLYNTINGYCHTRQSDRNRNNTHAEGGESITLDMNWEGMESMSSGDDVGFLLDLDEGTLSVYKNGRKLGVMKRGLTGPYCWVVSMYGRAQVTIKRGIDSIRV